MYVGVRVCCVCVCVSVSVKVCAYVARVHAFMCVDVCALMHVCVYVCVCVCVCVHVEQTINNPAIFYCSILVQPCQECVFFVKSESEHI